MLLIFDLDDTLLDTTYSFSFPMFLDVLKDVLPDEVFFRYQSLAEFLATTSTSLKEGIVTFCKTYFEEKGIVLDGSLLYERVIDRCREVLSDHNPFTLQVTRFCNETLLKLRKQHTLAVVTYGKKEFQLEKLRSSDIVKGVFSSIVTTLSSKKEAYNVLLKKYNVQKEDCIVVGDRIERDLVPAKELGMSTVHLKYGRGACDSTVLNNVDYTIMSLLQLPYAVEIITKSERG